MKPLFLRHPRTLTTLFGDVENAAVTMERVLVGTPGTINQRTNAGGFAYYAHQFYDADGAQRERYLAGPVGDPDAERVAEALRSGIAEANALAPSLRLLGREGYATLDAPTFATVAALHNHRIFEAGAVLVGSHAYGALLNALGARATVHATEDIDIGRAQRLDLNTQPSVGFAEMLADSGLQFAAIPPFERGGPSTSFKRIGRAQLQVDLLVPGGPGGTSTKPVAELQAHATALPFLGFVLEQTQWGVVISRHGACRVRLPVPERFAVHKLVTAQLRAGRTTKAQRDIEQGCVVAAVMSLDFPGALREAIELLPARATSAFRKSLPAAAALLHDHPAARAELGLDS